MLLTIDVGNTNISCGIFDKEELITTFRFITKQVRTSDELALQIHSILEVRGICESQITDVVLASVVPNINNDMISAIKQLFNVEPLMIAAGIKTGLKICIDDPKSCGADLIAVAIAGYDKYKGECMVVDFGTATKFLYVDEKGRFKYGIISPGLEIYANSLWQMTAQLPQVQLKKPETILAKNTVHSMQAGIVYGYIGLTEGIIKQVKKEIGHDFPVIATGGLGRYIYPETDLINDYDPNLAYYGMKLIYEKNK
ncbi:MAG TPA: type III pantothenate kinase [Erysipelotrichaceae bacterium]|jgi:type III pantothenate kinase|nr:type III pantothenate kinase [Erysipelotrichia bacterium]HPX32655.1 type III pantothenate kinase [Erysipelotrichaceae bacterium]HQA85334.1 type III pantothenate kinase [Erysipelotrichaceae bacterium]